MHSNRLKRAAVVLGAVLATALVLGAVGLTTAAAQEPDGAAAEIVASRPQPGDTMTTVLQPGDNLVGWIDDATPVADLFDAVAEIEMVWAWDALRRQWSAASRRVPSELHTLWTLKPGMGLLVQVGGDEAVKWQRSAYPARGLVELQPGHNLVAWSGRDGATMDYLALGLGPSLLDARARDAEHSEYRVYDPASSESAEGLQVVNRGDAVWINVSRAVNWLQPTGILPTVEFPGGAPADVRAKVQEMISHVVNFYSAQYGLEADASSYSIWYPADIDALVSAAADIGYDDNDPNWFLRENWEGGFSWVDSLAHGPIDDVIVMRGYPSLQASSSPTLAHEYFHVVQAQLSSWYFTPGWLGEGTAVWAEDEYQAATDAGEWNWVKRHEGQCRSAVGAPPLKYRAVGGTSGPASHYLLGWLAVSYLRDRSGSDSWLEFWRLGAQTKIGPHRRWDSLLPWEAAFQSVAGVSLERFYAAFDAWLRGQTSECADAETVNHKSGSIRGRLVAEDGQPVAGMTVVAARVERGATIEVAQPAMVRADGEFVLDVPRDGDYRIAVEVSEACRLFWYTGSGLDPNDASASVVVVLDGTANLTIPVPEAACDFRRVSGTVIGPTGIGLPGISVLLAHEQGSFFGTATDPEGAFVGVASATVPSGLALELSEGCLVNYGPDGPARTFVEWFSGHAGDVSGVHVRVPDDLCVRQISGHLISSNNQPLTQVEVFACTETSGCLNSATTNNDGAFAIMVGEEGADHFLTFEIGTVVWGDVVEIGSGGLGDAVEIYPGCEIYFSADGLTTRSEERLATRIADGDLRLSPRRIPDGMCAYQIKGRITQTDDQPLATTRISVCLEDDGDCVEWAATGTDEDGAFAITVPTEGRYRLSFNLEGCTVYFRAGGLTTAFDERSTVRVEGRGVQMNPRQIPADMCAHRISGRFVDANGVPLSGEWLQAFNAFGARSDWVETDADGRFEIRVPSDGAYSFDASLTTGCFYGFGGQALGSLDNPVRIRSADATGVTLQLPGTAEEVCR